MDIYEFIPNDRYISRTDLVDLTGLSSRAVRDKISKLKKQYVILSFSSQKGYRKVKPTEEMTKEEMELEYQEVMHCIREYQHRITDLKKSMRKLIARKKILEKEII